MSNILSILFISCYFEISIYSNLDITSIYLLICDGSVSSLPKFLSKMLLTFSETLTKVALPCTRVISEASSPLSED